MKAGKPREYAESTAAVIKLSAGVKAPLSNRTEIIGSEITSRARAAGIAKIRESSTA